MSQIEEYDVRRYRPGDEPAILDTFNLVFARDNPRFQPRTLEDFRYIFRENPAGIRLYVAMQGELCAASYATQPNRVRLRDGETVFSQVIDSMVHPDHRLGLKRPGLFVETARRMLADYHTDPLVFGMPNAQAWRMGKKFLDYEMVRWQGLLMRDAGTGSSDLPDEVVTLDGFDARVRRLYDRCAASWGASIVRDEAYLNWRFPRHPRNDYRIVATLGEDGALSGYAVYRPADWPIPGIGLLMDWLVPEGELRVGDLLREAVFRLARADGIPLIAAILPEWSRWFQDFQGWGFCLYPSDYLMSTAVAHRAHYDIWWLRDHWWYTLAEVDLV